MGQRNATIIEYCLSEVHDKMNAPPYAEYLYTTRKILEYEDDYIFIPDGKYSLLKCLRRFFKGGDDMPQSPVMKLGQQYEWAQKNYDMSTAPRIYIYSGETFEMYGEYDAEKAALDVIIFGLLTEGVNNLHFMFIKKYEEGTGIDFKHVITHLKYEEVATYDPTSIKSYDYIFAAIDDHNLFCNQVIPFEGIIKITCTAPEVWRIWEYIKLLYYGRFLPHVVDMKCSTALIGAENYYIFLRVINVKAGMEILRGRLYDLIDGVKNIEQSGEKFI